MPKERFEKASRAEVSTVRRYKCSQSPRYAHQLPPPRQRSGLRHKPKCIFRARDTHQLLLPSLKSSIIQLTQQGHTGNTESFLALSLKRWATAGERRGRTFMPKMNLMVWSEKMQAQTQTQLSKGRGEVHCAPYVRYRKFKLIFPLFQQLIPINQLIVQCCIIIHKFYVLCE